MYTFSRWRFRHFCLLITLWKTNFFVFVHRFFHNRNCNKPEKIYRTCFKKMKKITDHRTFLRLAVFPLEIALVWNGEKLLSFIFWLRWKAIIIFNFLWWTKSFLTLHFNALRFDNWVVWDESCNVCLFWKFRNNSEPSKQKSRNLISTLIHSSFLLFRNLVLFNKSVHAVFTNFYLAKFRHFGYFLKAIHLPGWW